jgi:hypothetical protein
MLKNEQRRSSQCIQRTGMGACFFTLITERKAFTMKIEGQIRIPSGCAIAAVIFAKDGKKDFRRDDYSRL